MERLKQSMSSMAHDEEIEATLGDPEAWEVPSRGPKRKSEKRRRGAVISVRLSPEELEAVQAAAASTGESVSTYMREQALRTRTPEVPALWGISMIFGSDVRNGTQQNPSAVGATIIETEGNSQTLRAEFDLVR